MRGSRKIPKDNCVTVCQEGLRYIGGSGPSCHPSRSAHDSPQIINESEDKEINREIEDTSK